MNIPELKSEIKIDLQGLLEAVWRPFDNLYKNDSDWIISRYTVTRLPRYTFLLLVTTAITYFSHFPAHNWTAVLSPQALWGKVSYHLQFATKNEILEALQFVRCKSGLRLGATVAVVRPITQRRPFGSGLCVELISAGFKCALLTLTLICGTLPTELWKSVHLSVNYDISLHFGRYFFRDCEKDRNLAIIPPFYTYLLLEEAGAGGVSCYLAVELQGYKQIQNVKNERFMLLSNDDSSHTNEAYLAET